jgi:hypothetical protein
VLEEEQVEAKAEEENEGSADLIGQVEVEESAGLICFMTSLISKL